MSRVFALIPARSGSRGIPWKNFRPFAGGPCLTWLACQVAHDARVDRIVVSSDIAPPLPPVEAMWLPRPAALAQDDTPMYAVVQHAVETLQLADEDIVVLLQPTQPLRTPEHVREAIRLLRETGHDAVVSLVELPRTHHAQFQVCVGDDGQIGGTFWAMPPRRQDVRPAYIRDGTVYAFYRRTVTEYNSIYGVTQHALIIPPEQSCELDTEADWEALERRWKERNGSASL